MSQAMKPVSGLIAPGRDPQITAPFGPKIGNHALSHLWPGWRPKGAPGAFYRRYLPLPALAMIRLFPFDENVALPTARPG
jgi:hypothetical protein